MRQPSRTSGRYGSRRRPRRIAVVRSSGSAKARLAVAVRRSTDQMPSTGLGSGAWGGSWKTVSQSRSLFPCVRRPERHRPASTLTRLVLTEIGEPDDAERPGRSTSPPRPASRATFSAAFTRDSSRHRCRSTVSPPFDRPRSALPHHGRRRGPAARSGPGGQPEGDRGTPRGGRLRVRRGPRVRRRPRCRGGRGASGQAGSPSGRRTRRLAASAARHRGPRRTLRVSRRSGIDGRARWRGTKADRPPCRGEPFLDRKCHFRDGIVRRESLRYDRTLTGRKSAHCRGAMWVRQRQNYSPSGMTDGRCRTEFNAFRP